MTSALGPRGTGGRGGGEGSGGKRHKDEAHEHANTKGHYRTRRPPWRFTLRFVLHRNLGPRTMSLSSPLALRRPKSRPSSVHRQPCGWIQIHTDLRCLEPLQSPHLLSTGSGPEGGGVSRSLATTTCAAKPADGRRAVRGSGRP